MKIFIGCDEVASIIHRLAEGFEGLGHQVTTLIRSPNHFYKNKYTYNLDLLSNFVDRKKIKSTFLDKSYGAVNTMTRSLYTKAIFPKLLKEHDVFIFLWSSLFPDFSDLQQIKKNNKRIASFFVGSDIREPYAFQQEFGADVSQWDDQYFTDINRKLLWLRINELYSDAIFTTPDAAGLIIRPYHHLYLPFPGKEYNFRIADNPVLKVLHAPSNKSIKGTDIILATLNRLKDEGLPIEIRLLSGVPHDTLKKVLEESDVLVDELILHGPGMLSFEAMASGCAVATRFLDECNDVFAPPVCSINEKNIYDQLKKLFIDKAYRHSLVENGREFIRQQTDPKKVAADVLGKTVSPNAMADYYPRFYLNQYRLPEGTVLSNENLQLAGEVIRRFGASRRTDFSAAVREGKIDTVPASYQYFD